MTASTAFPHLQTSKSMEFTHSKKTHNTNNKTKNLLVITITATLSLIAITHINHPSIPADYSNQPPPHNHSSYKTNPPSQDIQTTDDRSENCDISVGEWVPDQRPPYYTNESCWAIHDYQNCMKYGRPDSEFMKWRWKPDGCDLPRFNPFQFLDIVRDKSLAFVGDSVGRNQMQSMICLLSRVEYPIDESPTTDEHFKRWKYVSYNFTMSYFWSPFLVRSNEREPAGPPIAGLFNLYLDEPDPAWADEIDDFHYVILNSGHWLARPAIYYERRRVVGCRYCQLPNLTDLPTAYGHRRVIRTALEALIDRESFKGVAFLRTLSPSHFEGGAWDGGGDCVRRRPWRSNETALEGSNMEMYMTEVEEFRAAEKKKKRGKTRLRLLDTAQMMLLRPDGHPSRFGHWPDDKVGLYNDCVHWCLPGPIDSWADFFMHMVKMEARRWYKERVARW